MPEINYFLFEQLPPERMKWILSCTSILHKPFLKIWIAGDALLSFFTLFNQKNISDIISSKKEKILINIDKHSWNLHGFSKDLFSYFKSSRIRIVADFWDQMLKSSPQVQKSIEDRTGFLLLRGPYMDRTSVYALQFLNSSVKSALSPELYLYLDGINNGHAHQQPSAFLNIGDSIEVLLNKAQSLSLSSKILACSRCATARGYSGTNENHIAGYSIVNLNQIIEQFLHPHLLISPSSIQATYFSKNSEEKPILNIIITHPPYGSEWTFGGLSFAIAAASNHDILSRIIFIEDGVYSILGDHLTKEADRLFNVQEIIEATLFDENIEYYIYRESIEKRLDLRRIKFSEITLISSDELAELITPQNIDHNLIRTLIF